MLVPTAHSSAETSIEGSERIKELPIFTEYMVTLMSKAQNQ